MDVIVQIGQDGEAEVGLSCGLVIYTVLALLFFETLSNWASINFVFFDYSHVFELLTELLCLHK